MGGPIQVFIGLVQEEVYKYPGHRLVWRDDMRTVKFCIADDNRLPIVKSSDMEFDSYNSIPNNIPELIKSLIGTIT